MSPLNIHEPLELLLCALAVWRLSYMIAREKGPSDAFVRFRTVIPLGGLTSCIYCVSIWVAPVVILLWFFIPVLVVVLALSGGALMLHSYTGVGHGGEQS